jgi:hypothetical protein
MDDEWHNTPLAGHPWLARREGSPLYGSPLAAALSARPCQARCTAAGTRSLQEAGLRRSESGLSPLCDLRLLATRSHMHSIHADLVALRPKPHTLYPSHPC